MQNTANSFSGTTASGLYYQSEGAGSPVLCIHGIISDHCFFDGITSFLSHNHQVISYDRRRYGSSAVSDTDDLSVDGQADDAAEILRACDCGPAWINGNSAGGLIGISLALRYPELVKGLILMEPSLGYSEGEKEKLAAWNQELNDYVAAGRPKKALKAFTSIVGAESAVGGSGGMAEFKKTYANVNTFLYGELNHVQHYTPPVEDLKTISQPVVIITTELGRNTVFATSSRDGAAIIGWPVVEVPGYHNVCKDKPLEFALTLEGIISAMEMGWKLQ